MANTEPVSFDVPGVSDISKASADKARQLGVGHCCKPGSTMRPTSCVNIENDVLMYWALHKG